MSQALSHLDLVIAYIAILVMAASIVSTLTQLAIAILNKRQDILITHLAKLFEGIGLTPAEAQTLADDIVKHPKVQGGSVVQRERLVEILLEKAAGTDAVSSALKAKLGVTDPEATLQALRERVLKLEADCPALADHVRRTRAIVENALDQSGKAVMGGIVKIMSRFDQVCDQMTHAMKSHARGWTIGISAVVAVVLPFDSISVVTQLAKDPTAVQQLVATAKTLQDAGAPTNQVSDDLVKLQAQLTAQTQQLTNTALGFQPGAVFTAGYWRPEGADQTPACQVLLRLAGILISFALMSLGAPFWFDMLKNLLGLRPALASQETGERAERATTTST